MAYFFQDWILTKEKLLKHGDQCLVPKEGVAGTTLILGTCQNAAEQVQRKGCTEKCDCLLNGSKICLVQKFCDP